MRKLSQSRIPALLLGLGVALASAPGFPDDIDIFTQGGGGKSDSPNVLIILDNTSNWARQSQQWPEKDPLTGQALQQGQSEARGIKTALGAVGSDINVGIMEFVTEGTANDDGGYIRRAIKPMDTTNKAALNTAMDMIFNDVNGVHEKRNSNTEYGNLMYDAYNYLAGRDAVSPNAVDSTRADSDGYTSNYTTFKAPLSAAQNCAHTFIVFIANPNSTGPANDTAANLTSLGNLPHGSELLDDGTHYTDQLKMPVVKDNAITKLGYTSACYTSTASCSTADFAKQCSASAGCYCDDTDTTTSLPSCVGGQKRYNVVATSTSTSTTPVATTGTSACYTSSTACGTGASGSDHGGLTCPSNTDTGSGTNPRTVVTHSCSYACGGTTSACANLAGTPVTASSSCTSGGNCSSYTTGCYVTSIAAQNAADKGVLVCPSGSTCSYSYGTPSSSTSSIGTSCGAGTSAFTVTASASAQSAPASAACYSGQSACTSASDRGGQTCPSGSSSDTGAGVYPRTVVSTNNTCSYACASTATQGSCADSVNSPTTSTSSTTSSSSANTSACYTSAGTCTSAGDHAGLSCPATTSTDSWSGGTQNYPRVQTTTTHSCSWACGSQVAASCLSSASTSTSTTTTQDYASACSASTGPNASGIVASTDANRPTCPSATDTGASSDPRIKDTFACTYSTSDASGHTNNCGGSGNAKNFTIYETVVDTQQTTSYSQHQFGVTMTDVATTVTTNTPGNHNYTFPVTQSVVNNTTETYTPGIANNKYGITQTDSQTTTTTSSNSLGNTFACYSSAAAATTSDYSSTCGAGGTSCSIDANSGGTEGVCPHGQRYAVQSQATIPEVTAVDPAQFLPPSDPSFKITGNVNMDEWARYMHDVGVPVVGGDNQKVSTYTIDVYYRSPNDTTSSLLMNTASASGGKYFAAHNEQEIVDALKQILTEIQAVNSAFASASLPVNATNRAQDKNQVFIGMFRPTQDATPRWYGNLKQYQLVLNGGRVDLGDANGNVAVSSTTGFVTDCAPSFWTSDTGTYWRFSDPKYNPHALNTSANNPAKSGCLTATTSPYSDMPDGPLVEKGAAAEVLRLGNDPASTATYKVNRQLWSLPSVTSSGPLVPFDSSTTFTPAFATTPTNTLDYARGWDVNDENQNGAGGPSATTSETRPSIHGDVVHSRPQPVDYGSTTGVVVFYGGNDGVFHAARANDGLELWGFVAPEFFPKFQRLSDNCPLINYTKKVPVGSCTTPDGSDNAAVSKDYFFDGSVGLYESNVASGTSPKVWIYPSMRRGGRMIYALDVSDPSTPVFKWKFGCSDMTTSLRCTSHAGDANTTPKVTDIGQTWSTPDVAFLKGYSTTKPVVILGGGNDPPALDPSVVDADRGCEDQDASPDAITVTCLTGGKGHGVYVLDGDTGKLLASFPTDRSVVADMTLLDTDFDGNADYGYVVDMGGNIYRIDFVDSSHNAVDQTQWKIHKVAHTKNAGRRFEFAPALVQADATTVYVAVGSGDREHPLICNYPFPTASAGTGNCPSGTNNAGITNRFYVYKDSLAQNLLDDSNLSDTNLDSCPGMANYTNGATSANSCSSSTSSVSSDCSTASILPSSTQRGWFIDLIQNGPGEQVVTSPVIAGGLIKFSTNRPLPPSGFSCLSNLGDARGYSLNLLNASGNLGQSGTCGGARSKSFLGGGLPPSPVLATVPINGVVKTVLIGAIQSTGIQSEIGAQETKPNIKSTRKPVYWYKTPGGDSE